jgi:hypothetical protein
MNRCHCYTFEESNAIDFAIALYELKEHLWEILHNSPWNEVSLELRDMYALTVLAYLTTMSISKESESSIEEDIQLADNALLLGDKKYSSQLNNIIDAKVSILRGRVTKKRIINDEDSASNADNKTSRRRITIQKDNIIPVRNSAHEPMIILQVVELSYDRFYADYMNKSIPVVLITHECRRWPCISDRKRQWKNLDFWISSKHDECFVRK